MVSSYPSEFVLQNAEATKMLNVVVEIEGYDFKFSTVATFKALRYGDPGINYGDPGLVYGGLIPDTSTYPYLSLNSSLIISQKVEPEQGRASASTFSLEFLDKDGFMSNFVTPDQQLDEVLGGRQVKIRMGYQNTSYPEDYYVIFRGYITMTTLAPTKVILQLTDANVRRRSQIFFCGKTKLRQIIKNFLPANVDVVNDIFNITSHGLQNGMIVYFNSDTAIPSPLAPATDYYIINATTNSFQISLTLGGSAINIVSAGAGTLQFVLQDIGPTSTVIPVYAVDGFAKPIIGPDGSYDPTFTGYIIAANEIMSYTQNAIDSVNLTITVTRGALGTTPQSNLANDELSAGIGLTGNVLDIALKTMLSGWGGVWSSNNAIYSFGQTNDPLYGTLSNAMILPDKVDAVEDYGLAVGDYIYVTGGLNAGTYTVSGFLDSDKYRNKIILFNQNVAVEFPTAATFSIRSQYDTLPFVCGNKLRPLDIDVAGWRLARRLFAFQADNTFRFLITDSTSCKEFIESELLLPVGAYSVTRFGRISCSFTKPPLASQNLVTLSSENIINPQQITVTRGLNDRRYFSEVQYYYDANNKGDFTNILKRLSSSAISKTKTSTVLPIKATGLRTDLSAETFIARRSQFLLSRYQGAAYAIKMQVNFEAGALIEVSDVVAVVDKGGLQIANLETGLRDLEAQLFEVQERSLNLANGQATLTLLSQIGYQISDRFGGISPSSKITGGSTSVVEFVDSFGALFPNNEYLKYNDIIGDRVNIHSPDFSFSEEVTILGFDSVNTYKMMINPPLSMTPQPGWIIDIAKYPNNTSKADNAKTKLLYAFVDPSIQVTGGTSTTVFTVNPSRAAEITPDLPVKIHDQFYGLVSSESYVDSVVGNTVTLKTAIEFTPSAGQTLELIGFIDGLGPYRLL